MKIIVLCIFVGLTTQINVRCTPANFGETVDLDFRQEGCPANSHCLRNGFCDCDVGYIGGCTQQASRMENGGIIQTTVDNQNYSFFEIIGSTSVYTLLAFQLCLKDQSSNADFYVDIWDDNGTIDVFSKQNADMGGKLLKMNTTCVAFNTFFMLFGTKINGETQGFILGLKRVTPGTQKVTLSLQITELDFWGLMFKIIFVLGSCFAIVLLIAVIYVIYKCRRRHTYSTRSNREKDIAHLEVFMPMFKLQSERGRLAGELCSICLLELGETLLRKTVCAHLFHQECLDSWCRNHLSCPVCRRSFQLEDLKNGSEVFEQSQDESLRRSILR